jgi:hypothetical protein
MSIYIRQPSCFTTLLITPFSISLNNLSTIPPPTPYISARSAVLFIPPSLPSECVTDDPSVLVQAFSPSANLLPNQIVSKWNSLSPQKPLYSPECQFFIRTLCPAPLMAHRLPNEILPIPYILVNGDFASLDNAISPRL